LAKAPPTSHGRTIALDLAELRLVHLRFGRDILLRPSRPHSYVPKSSTRRLVQFVLALIHSFGSGVSNLHMIA
jgi:hypothetical protein